MSFGRTTFGHFFKKRYIRKIRARKRAQADLFKWQQEQQRVAEDNQRTARMILRIYGIEKCRAALLGGMK
jgi:hypothetical protein